MSTKVQISKKVQVALFGIFMLFFSVSSSAQCAMCRAALGSQEDTSQAEAVNDGIVYLMIIPYILVGAIVYAIYSTRQKKKKLL